MQCSPSLVLALSSLLGALGFLLLCLNLRAPARYGKHQEKPGKPWTRVPARGAWFLQELPSFLVPALLLALRSQPRLEPLGCRLLCGMFCGHYFHRTFIYSFFTRGRPFPLQILLFGTLFCIYNGFLQGYYMIYCAQYPKDWFTDFRFTSGVLLFLIGMGINIHSDILLRQLRKPGDHTYKIPQGFVAGLSAGSPSRTAAAVVGLSGAVVEWPIATVAAETPVAGLTAVAGSLSVSHLHHCSGSMLLGFFVSQGDCSHMYLELISLVR
ncbi:3-oxo-5-alpha-steroid 4-dehydrogenase 2 isoform X1 [Malaclemys terrapin pileata]|uniref:3-oxo-5-alpha-steroid 4-dehydrogenase 2 isoform X1 n=1 Tax=Malaclemys terrapin pileata TaxID=2991368 RepID=UPI0023A8FD4D|nr:3-oxo-5-alpha-steroid 4-dehydrogenase 2 isoform X1 [Malaclemys terrapin pileata]